MDGRKSFNLATADALQFGPVALTTILSVVGVLTANVSPLLALIVIALAAWVTFAFGLWLSGEVRRSVQAAVQLDKKIHGTRVLRVKNDLRGTTIKVWLHRTVPPQRLQASQQLQDAVDRLGFPKAQFFRHPRFRWIGIISIPRREYQ